MSSTGYTAQYITDKLKQNLETTHLSVEDMSDGCGAKFNAVIVSPKFDGIPLLQRHRMVNTLLETEMKTIHAFTMKTMTPKQFETQNQKIHSIIECFEEKIESYMKKMVNILVKIVFIVLIILFVYHIFVSIDLNRVIRWIKLVNTTRSLRQLISEEAFD